MTNNELIKKELKQLKIPQWKVATLLGICEMTLIRWLRMPLSESKEFKIRSIIAELKKGA